MTLTELRYLVAVARERHFGRAAESCHASQPTLSLALRKLERELGVQLFERGGGDVSPTAIGERVVAQALRVLEEADRLARVASEGRDPLQGPLRVATIYTIGPYLLPALVRQLQGDAPGMPLLLAENYTVNLLEMLRNGQVDAAVLALPLADAGLQVEPLYDEDFLLGVPRDHAWARRRSVAVAELAGQRTLLLGAGHCFRDQVLDACPELQRGGSPGSAGSTGRPIEGSSLETIRQMVASGIGVAVLPATAVPARVGRGALVNYLPFRGPAPCRRVGLAWRRSFPRPEAIRVLLQGLRRCRLPPVRWLEPETE